MNEYEVICLKKENLSVTHVCAPLPPNCIHHAKNDGGFKVQIATLDLPLNLDFT